jgi:hypothetical protein
LPNSLIGELQNAVSAPGAGSKELDNQFLLKQGSHWDRSFGLRLLVSKKVIFEISLLLNSRVNPNTF